MSGFSGSRIVTDKLVLCLDAANLNSYPGSGNSWTDLISKNVGTLTNGPTYNDSNGGFLSFDGIDDFVTQSFSGLSGGNNPFTLSFWAYSDAAAAANPETPFWYGNESTGQAIRIRFNTDGTISIAHWGGIGYDWSASGFVTNTWLFITETYNGTTDIIYKNGVQLGSSNINALSIPTSSNVILGKRPNGEIYGGRIAQVYLYDKALSAEEIMINFNATRRRFGI